MKSKILNRENWGQYLFWFAFLCELSIFAFHEIDGRFDSETVLLRICCALFCLKICLTKYSKKEWLLFILFSLLGVLAFLKSGNGIDLIFRSVIFIFAAKDIPRRRLFSTFFYALIATYAWIIFQCFLGNRVLVDIRDYGRGEIEARYNFGFFHANVFHYAMYTLLILCIYLYQTKLKLWHYGLFLMLSFIITYFSRSRTGELLMLLAICLSCLLKYSKFLQNHSFLLFGTGIIVLATCILISVLTVVLGPDSPPMDTLNSLLTGRIVIAHDAIQRTYLSLFSELELVPLLGEKGDNLLIDMGYIRFAYGYGLVPAILYIAVSIYALWKSCKTKNYGSYVLLITIFLLTTVEAHQFSRDIIFNYTLLLVCGYEKNTEAFENSCSC